LVDLIVRIQVYSYLSGVSFGGSSMYIGMYLFEHCDVFIDIDETVWSV